jgi:hypothetical protein
MKTSAKTHIAKQSIKYPNHRLLVHNPHTTKQNKNKKTGKFFSSAGRIGLRPMRAACQNCSPFFIAILVSLDASSLPNQMLTFPVSFFIPINSCST